ncbi:MAG: hypothetical protein PSX79_04965 [bacterium]|nr:hypothetical protein [bacterium]
MTKRLMSGGMALTAADLSDVSRFNFGQEQHLAPVRDRADDGPADYVPNA